MFDYRTGRKPNFSTASNPEALVGSSSPRPPAPAANSLQVAAISSSSIDVAADVRRLKLQNRKSETSQSLLTSAHVKSAVKTNFSRSATDDSGVFEFAQGAQRVIISCNRNHFLKLAGEAVAKAQSFAGLIILVRRRTRQAECAHLLSLLRQAGESGVKGNINLA